MKIGIDLGGTKTEIAVLDGNGIIVLRERISTPASSYQAVLAALQNMIEMAEARVGVQCSIGLATPGSISRLTGEMKNCNSTYLNGQTLALDLERRLGRAVRIANDANCFGLSEAVDGAAAGARVVFGVILGTGVGGAIVADRKILDGPNGIAGEWGHNPLPGPSAQEQRDAPACYCGRRGCIETWLCGPALAADHLRHTGQTRSTHAIVDAASRDTACRATLERYWDRLARSLAVVINIVDPDVIVLGGGLSNIMETYPQVRQRWGAYVFSDHVDTRLVPNLHGDSSGVRGAAWLWD